MRAKAALRAVVLDMGLGDVNVDPGVVVLELLSGVAALHAAWQVHVFDPRWGRDDLLWSFLGFVASRAEDWFGGHAEPAAPPTSRLSSDGD